MSLCDAKTYYLINKFIYIGICYILWHNLRWSIFGQTKKLLGIELKRYEFNNEWRDKEI